MWLLLGLGWNRKIVFIFIRLCSKAGNRSFWAIFWIAALEYGMLLQKIFLTRNHLQLQSHYSFIGQAHLKMITRAKAIYLLKNVLRQLVLGIRLSNIGPTNSNQGVKLGAQARFGMWIHMRRISAVSYWELQTSIGADSASQHQMARKAVTTLAWYFITPYPFSQSQSNCLM